VIRFKEELMFKDIDDHLQEFQSLLHYPHLDLFKIKGILIQIFEFLLTPQGRSQENLNSVQKALLDVQDLEEKLDAIPEDYADIIENAASLLHETLKDPQLVEDMEATPEILLRKAKGLVT
jgi:hypothetical protein